MFEEIQVMIDQCVANHPGLGKVFFSSQSLKQGQLVQGVTYVFLHFNGPRDERLCLLEGYLPHQSTLQSAD